MSSTIIETPHRALVAKYMAEGSPFHVAAARARRECLAARIASAPPIKNPEPWPELDPQEAAELRAHHRARRERFARFLAA